MGPGARTATLLTGEGGSSATDFDVSAIDLGIIVAYIVGTIALGYWFSKKSGNDSGEGFFLGGRSFVWPLVGFSLLASNLSGSSFVGFAGAGYNQGVGVYNYEWVAAIVLILFALFVLPFYLRSKVFTMPEFLERRFDRRSRYAFSVFTIVANLFIDASGALFAGGLVIQTIYPDIPLDLIVLGIAIVAGAYTVVGGLSAVVITDTVQAVLLMIGGGIILVAAYLRIQDQGGLEAVREATDEAGGDFFSVIQPASDENMPWIGLLTGVVVIGFYFWVCNQVIVQRVLGAKDESHGRRGLLFAGALKLPGIFLFVLPGVFALALYPDLESPDLAFPTLTFDLLPVGLRGLVLAALIAAIMSSLDSTLNSVSTLVTVDFFQVRNPDMSEQRQVWIGRVATVVFAVLAVLWAPRLQTFESLFDYLQSFLSYTVPAVVVVFLGGIFYRRASSTAAFVVLAVGFPAGIALWALNEIVFQDGGLQFLIFGGVLFLVWAVVLVVVSELTTDREKVPAVGGPDQLPEDPTDPDAEGHEVADHDLIWTPNTWREETEELRGKPWYENYRLLSGALGILTALFVLPWIPGVPNGLSAAAQWVGGLVGIG